MRDSKKTSRKKSPTTTSLPAIRPDVAGIDVGSSQHWVCAPPNPGGEPNVRVFCTTTPDLQELLDSVSGAGVTPAAIGSTSGVWMPPYPPLDALRIQPAPV